MWIVSKFFVVIYLFLLIRICENNKTANKDNVNDTRAPTDEDDIDDTIVPEFGDSYVFLVIGGYRPKKHNLAKHIVSMKFGRETKFFGDNHFCGGTIISTNVILTAAHCVINEKKNRHNPDYSVVSGSPFLFEKDNFTRLYKISKYKVHPGFSYSTMRSDMALLFTEEDIVMNDATQSIPIMNVKPKKGLKCTALGWGRLFPRGPRPDEVVYVDLQLLGSSECAEMFPMNPTVICATDVNDYEKSVWKGDSGGPLICNGKLVGVVSFGYIQGGPNYFTNVYEHRKWIEENSSTRPTWKTLIVIDFCFKIIFLFYKILD